MERVPLRIILLQRNDAILHQRIEAIARFTARGLRRFDDHARLREDGQARQGRLCHFTRLLHLLADQVLQCLIQFSRQRANFLLHARERRFEPAIDASRINSGWPFTR